MSISPTPVCAPARSPLLGETRRGRGCARERGALPGDGQPHPQQVAGGSFPSGHRAHKAWRAASPPQSLCGLRPPPGRTVGLQSPARAAAQRPRCFLLAFLHFVLRPCAVCTGAFGEIGVSSLCSGEGRSARLWASEEARAGKCGPANIRPGGPAALSTAKLPCSLGLPATKRLTRCPPKEPVRPAVQVPARGTSRTGSQLSLPWDASGTLSSLQVILPPQWRQDLPSVTHREGHGGWCPCPLENVLGSP